MKDKIRPIYSEIQGYLSAHNDNPFSGNPSTIINQNQQQNQNIQVEILLDMQSRIDEKMNQFEEGSKEKTFLQKVKAGLSSAKNIV